MSRNTIGCLPLSECRDPLSMLSVFLLLHGSLVYSFKLFLNLLGQLVGQSFDSSGIMLTGERKQRNCIYSSKSIFAENLGKYYSFNSACTCVQMIGFLCSYQVPNHLQYSINDVYFNCRSLEYDQFCQACCCKDFPLMLWQSYKVPVIVEI